MGGARSKDIQGKLELASLWLNLLVFFYCVPYPLTCSLNLNFFQQKMPPSLHDILQFRKAMEFMDNPYCFSTAFGLVRFELILCEDSSQ